VVWRVTGAGEKEWTIEKKDASEFIDGGKGMLENGNFIGIRNLLYGMLFKGYRVVIMRV